MTGASRSVLHVWGRQSCMAMASFYDNGPVAWLWSSSMQMSGRMTRKAAWQWQSSVMNDKAACMTVASDWQWQGMTREHSVGAAKQMATSKLYESSAAGQQWQVAWYWYLSNSTRLVCSSSSNTYDTDRAAWMAKQHDRGEIQYNIFLNTNRLWTSTGHNYIG